MNQRVTDDEVLEVFWEIFSHIADATASIEGESDENVETEEPLYRFTKGFAAARDLAESGYLRTDLTAQLVGDFINSVEVIVDPQHPALSKAALGTSARKKVEVLKNYTYEATIFSTRLKVAEFRGYEVVERIFDALSGPKGFLLMPDDVRRLHNQFEDDASARMRVICDFVAGMTDRYAVEFYGRLHSDNAQSIFKPT